MSLAIRNQIIAALATDALTLTAENGYSFTQRTVVQDFVNVVATSLPLPLVMLVGGDEEHDVMGPGSRAASGEMANEFELHVAVIMKTDGQNVQRIGGEMLADVLQLYTALNRTITLTGSPASTIVRILPIKSRPIVGDVAGNRAGGEVVFLVRYRTRLGQPRVGA